MKFIRLGKSYINIDFIDSVTPDPNQSGKYLVNVQKRSFPIDSTSSEWKSFLTAIGHGTPEK